jgi:hypothetical protein
MNSCVVQMIDYCERNCNKENSKISVAFNYCSLEKVVLKKRAPNQEIGLSFISLVDGIFTVGEINRLVMLNKVNFKKCILKVNANLYHIYDYKKKSRPPMSVLT